MKHALMLALTPTLVAGLASWALAQGSATPTASARGSGARPATDAGAPEAIQDGTRARDDNATRPAWRNTRRLHETKDLLGTRITDTKGEELGQLDQLLIDPKTGRITHAVIGLGGVLGIGKTEVVVPFSALKLGPMHEDGKADITMDRTVLDRAPLYDARVAHGTSAVSASPATVGSSAAKGAGSPGAKSDKDVRKNDKK